MSLSTPTRSVSEGSRFTRHGNYRLSERSPSLTLRVGEIADGEVRP
jgi:hypothetical protein